MAQINSKKDSLTIRLGADLQTPINTNFTAISGLDVLLQDMQLLLLTSPGERVFRPTFGGGLRGMVWENIADAGSNGTAVIRHALETYEPRITVVDVTSQVNENTGLIIYNIQFIVKSVDQAINLVFPMRVSTDLSFA